jgi:hypothetical protein
MRTRRWQDLHADIETGFMSTAMMLMGNIAYRTGRKLVFDGKEENFINDEEANLFLTRDYRAPFLLPDQI